MAEKGIVIEINGGVAKVGLDRTSACGRCGLCRSLGPGKVLMEVESVAGLHPGQTVLVEEGEKSWAASIFLFLVPLTGLVTGVILGQYVTISGLSNASSAVFGAGFFAISFAGAACWERRMRSGRRRPRIVMVCETGPPHHT